MYIVLSQEHNEVHQSSSFKVEYHQHNCPRVPFSQIPELTPVLKFVLIIILFFEKQICHICIYLYILLEFWASQVALVVKNLPANAETPVRSLGWEDSLEEGMATHSRIPAWRTPMIWQGGAWRATGHMVAKSQT